MSKALSARVRKARKTKGFSTTKLDDRAGLTRGHTWQIETGRKPRIELATATKLAAALGVSLDWLVRGVGQGPVAA